MICVQVAVVLVDLDVIIQAVLVLVFIQVSPMSKLVFVGLFEGGSKSKSTVVALVLTTPAMELYRSVS